MVESSHLWDMTRCGGRFAFHFCVILYSLSFSVLEFILQLIYKLKISVFDVCEI